MTHQTLSSGPGSPEHPAGDQAAAEQAAREQALVDEVVASFAGAQSPRLRELMQALARHVHALVRETRLTEEEWAAAIEFLTAVGHITDDKRQEFILLSDVLGLSMQTITVNNEAVGDATEATVFGPFFVEGAPRIELGGDLAFGAKGRPCWVEGMVTDIDGRPLPGARIEVWEADENGFYDVQDPAREGMNLRGLFTSDGQGRYEVHTVRPIDYTIPDDGPVGKMLQAASRHPWRPAHIHVIASAPGYKSVTTHCFDAKSAYLDSDAVFGVRPSLIVDMDGGEAVFDIVLDRA